MFKHVARRRLRAYKKCVFVLVTTFFFCGCGYPKVSSETYEISKALYSVCNRQNEAQLANIESAIETASESGEISPREVKWLKEIVDSARSGEWQRATAEARKIMVDQVEF